MKYLCVPKITRLTRRVDFVRLTHYSKQKDSRSVTPAFILQLKPIKESSEIAIGFTATKKLGNAIIRALAKRRLRAVVDACMRLNPSFQGHKSGTGYHLNLIAREGVLKRPMPDMQADLKKSMTYHGFLWKK